MTKEQKREIVVGGLLVALLAFLLWLFTHKKSQPQSNELPPQEPLPGIVVSPFLPNLPTSDNVTSPTQNLPCSCHTGCNQQIVTLNTDAAAISQRANSAVAQIYAMGNALLEKLASMENDQSFYSLVTPE